jgi:hypothetical protein
MEKQGQDTLTLRLQQFIGLVSLNGSGNSLPNIVNEVRFRPLHTSRGRRRRREPTEEDYLNPRVWWLMLDVTLRIPSRRELHLLPSKMTEGER